MGPRKVHRSTTASPSPIRASSVMRTSGKAPVIPAKARRSPARSGSVQQAAAASMSFAFRASIQRRTTALFASTDVASSG